MRVALVSEWVDAWRGGAETSTLQFIHYLMSSGVELHLFTRSRPSPTPGMQVHTVSGAAMSRTRSSVTFARRVERLIRADKYDVVHAISPCLYANIYQPRGGTVAESIERNLALCGSPAARLFKRYANHFNFKQRYMLALERRIMGGPEGPIVVAISDYVADQLRRHYSLPDTRIRRVFNAIDPGRPSVAHQAAARAAIRREFHVGDDDCLVLLIAHNFRLKGVQRWMEALAMLVQRGVNDVRSVVLGKGESRQWHRLSARLGIAEYLTFAGPSDRVAAFLDAADVLVHPSYYDPCSRVVMEALVAGLPCITTRWDGAAELIENNANGYVLDDPGDVEGLCYCLERLRDVDLRRRLGTAAAAVAGRVSMARHTEEIVSLYEEVVNASVPAV